MNFNYSKGKTISSKKTIFSRMEDYKDNTMKTAHCNFDEIIIGEMKEYPFLWFNSCAPSDVCNRNTYALFRHSMELQQKPRSAVLRISAGNYYKLYVNGHYLGRGPVREAAPYYQYDEHDVCGQLQAGKNVIAVQVYHRGLQTFTEKIAVMGLWVEGEIHTEDKVCQISQNPGQWKVIRDNSFKQNTPHWSKPIKGDPETTGWGPGPQEYKDMRMEQTDWALPGFNDDAWQRPEIIPVNLIFSKRLIPFLRETPMHPVSIMRLGQIPEPFAARIEPSARSESDSSFAVKFKDYPIEEPTTLLISNPEAILHDRESAASVMLPPRSAAYIQIDFGKQVTGYPVIDVAQGVSGVVIDLAYSEDVLQTERPNTDFERTYTAGRITLRDGAQVYQAAFLIHGFRYMGMVIRNTGSENITMDLKSVAVNFISYPVERCGSFQCDDPLFNRIYEVSEWTNRLCMHDLYEDCPRREQVQWLAEAAIQSFISYYLYGDTALVRQLLLMGTHYRGNNFPSFIPTSDLWDPGIATYPMHFVLAAVFYYYKTGDEDTLRKVLPTCREIVGYLLTHVNGSGLFSPGTDRQVFDLPPGKPTIPCMKASDYGAHLHTNCHFLKTLQGLADIENRLGDYNLAQTYEQQADKLISSIKKYFWDDAKGYFAGSVNGKKTYTSIAFSGDAIWSGAADRKQVDRMWPRLFMNDTDPAEGVAGAGYVGSFYMIRGLFAGPVKHHRHIDAFYRKHYKAMLDAGATTFWETYPENNQKLSFVHGTCGHFPFFAGSEILGVTPVEPGFTVFRIYPKILNLRAASGVVPSPYGPIEVDWKIGGEAEFSIKVTIPEQTVCHLCIPDQMEKLNTVIKNSAGKTMQVKLVKNREKTAYKLESGKYLLFCSGLLQS